MASRLSSVSLRAALCSEQLLHAASAAPAALLPRASAQHAQARAQPRRHISVWRKFQRASMPMTKNDYLAALREGEPPTTAAEQEQEADLETWTGPEPKRWNEGPGPVRKFFHDSFWGGVEDPTHNPFLAPKDTFIPLGRTFSDLQATQAALRSGAPGAADPKAVVPKAAAPTPHSQPYIYQTGGFISATSISALNVPGTRASVSGIVATVFGGYGFIGRRVLGYLGRIGSQIIVPYRGQGFNVRRTKLAGEVGQVVHLPYEWDDLSSVAKALQRTNVVVNCMGSNTETPNFSYDDVHVKCTHRLCEMAKAAGHVERFIHVSAIGADPRSPSAYLRSKGEGENIVRHFFPDATILRLAPVFGQDDQFIRSFGAPMSSFSDIFLHNQARQMTAPIYVNDVARAVLSAIAFGESLGELYFLTGPKNYNIEGLVNIVLRSSYADPHKHPDLVRKTSLLHDIILYQDWQEKRDDLAIHNEATNTVEHLVRGIWKKLAQGWRYDPDQVPRAYAHQIVPSDVASPKTLFDLGVEATPLEEHIDAICLQYRQQRGPRRFLDVERLGSKTAHLA